jgi:hypothetical protein
MDYYTNFGLKEKAHTTDSHFQAPSKSLEIWPIIGRFALVWPNEHAEDVVDVVSGPIICQP